MTSGRILVVAVARGFWRLRAWRVAESSADWCLGHSVPVAGSSAGWLLFAGEKKVLLALHIRASSVPTLRETDRCRFLSVKVGKPRDVPRSTRLCWQSVLACGGSVWCPCGSCVVRSFVSAVLFASGLSSIAHADGLPQRYKEPVCCAPFSWTGDLHRRTRGLGFDGIVGAW